MMGVYIALTVLVLVQLGQGVLLFKMKQKLNNAMFLKRKDSTVFFEDYQGNEISEKIIIEPRK